MRSLCMCLGVASAVLIVFCADVSRSGQVWTDTNGDGQPDTGIRSFTPSTTITVDLWIDSQSFTYTAYTVWAEWTQGFTRVGTGVNHMPGCSNDPNNTSDHPRGIGFSGSSCEPPMHGVRKIGTFQLHVGFLSPMVVFPIIDPSNKYAVFSLLTSPSGYLLFSTHGITVVEPELASGTSSWGRIKGQFEE